MADRPISFWYRVPASEPWKTWRNGLPPAAYRVVDVVLESIQRDRNPGVLSYREVARRSGISPRHARLALDAIVAGGPFTRIMRHGSTAKYTLSLDFADANRVPTGTQQWVPTGEQSDSKCSPTGTQLEDVAETEGTHHWVPTGEQHWVPTGTQTQESLESSEILEEEEGALATIPPPNKPADGYWTSERKEHVHQALLNAASWKMDGAPSNATLDEITRNMIDEDDFNLWLADDKSLLASRKSWGGFVTAARRWPKRRAVVVSELATMKAEAADGIRCPHGNRRGTCLYLPCADREQQQPAPPPPPRPETPAKPKRQPLVDIFSERYRQQTNRWRSLMGLNPPSAWEQEFMNEYTSTYERRDEILDGIEAGSHPWAARRVAA